MGSRRPASPTDTPPPNEKEKEKEKTRRVRRQEERAAKAERKAKWLAKTTSAAKVTPAPVLTMRNNDGLPTAFVRTGRTQVALKIDSCARFTIAGAGLAHLGVPLEVETAIQSVQGLGGGELRVTGVTAFVVTTVYGQELRVEALLVAGYDDEILLGADWLSARGALVDFAVREIRYDDGEEAVIVPFECCNDDVAAGPGRGRVARTLKVCSGNRGLARVSVAGPDGQQGLFVPHQGQWGSAMVAPTVATVQSGQVRVSVMNACGSKAKLPRGAELGTWLPLSGDMEVLDATEALSTSAVRRWLTDEKGDNPNAIDGEDTMTFGDMGESERAMFRQLFRCYPELFSTASRTAKTTLAVEHHIATGDAAPIFQRRLRNSQVENAVIDAEVEQMLKDGVIEAGHGAWGFPVVLIKKKDGAVRFCVDYRALNNVTAKDVYPLPRIDETLEQLGGACRFSTLDLKAGYWQIGVAPKDQDKTAFVTRRGLFRFRRMPFGLSNAPATFQRMMDCLLRGLTWVCCLVYVDDIIVYSPGGLGRHAVEMAVVLERLSQAGLTLKPSKCVVAATTIEYLGHELSADGVRPIERLVTSVSDFPQPTDPTTIKRFVHLAGYYRRFVPDFGARMAPLTRLLRKNEAWQWGSEQAAAFQWIKDKLSTKPVLVYPDFRRSRRTPRW